MIMLNVLNFKDGLLGLQDMKDIIEIINISPSNIKELFLFFNKYRYTFLSDTLNLLKELNILERDEKETYYLKSKDISDISLSHIAEKILNYVISNTDNFFISVKINDDNVTHYRIPYKYHIMRNFLITECIIAAVGELYIINNQYRPFILNAYRKKRKTVSLEQLKETLLYQQEIGEKAEQYVLLLEKRKFPQKEINYVSPIDVAVGYDIYSYISSNSITPDKMIEVKCIANNKGQFYISSNELKTAKENHESYFLYIVDPSFSREPLQISNVYEKIVTGHNYSIENYRVELNQLGENY